jgi:transcription antitermination factor NusG
MSDPRLNETLSSTFSCKSKVSIMGHNGEAYDPDSRWYAVWTRSRQEKVVAAMLSALGIQHYLPLKSELRQWSDRKQMVEAPLFSGYLFVCINSLRNSKLQVLKVPGVGAFVGNLTGSLPIPDQQIEDIRRVLTAGVECSVQPLLKGGDLVRVVRGALAGVEGTLVRTHSTSRLLISIEMIRQSLSVNILRADVELVSTNSVHAMHYGQSAAIPGGRL